MHTLSLILCIHHQTYKLFALNKIAVTFHVPQRSSKMSLPRASCRSPPGLPSRSRSLTSRIQRSRSSSSAGSRNRFGRALVPAAQQPARRRGRRPPHEHSSTPRRRRARSWLRTSPRGWAASAPRTEALSSGCLLARRRAYPVHIIFLFGKGE